MGLQAQARTYAVAMKPLGWNNGKLWLIDQTRLPHENVTIETDDYRVAIEAIKALRVRGAPAIGIAGAYALAVGARQVKAASRGELLAQLRRIADEIASARPTAVNLAWAVRRCMVRAEAAGDVDAIRVELLDEAHRIRQEDEDACHAMGRHGAALLPQRATVLTHCNAGALATADYGTALGVLRAARDAGKQVRVIATETRPLLQGARLTAWELVQDGFDVTLITDSMAGHFLHRGGIDAVVVGADRIAANGDTANKIGTYTLAVMAKENGVPFYVAAPMSTVDLSLADGSRIPIEERKAEEVTHIRGQRIAAEGVRVANPAFDVTPHQYIRAIITERGVAPPPYVESLKLLASAQPSLSRKG